MEMEVEVTAVVCAACSCNRVVHDGVEFCPECGRTRIDDGVQLYLGMLVGGSVDGSLCEFNGDAIPEQDVDIRIPDEIRGRIKVGDTVRIRPYRIPCGRCPKG